MLRLRQGAAQGKRSRLLTRGRADLREFAVLRVAWTLADLAGRAVPGTGDVAEALGMRLQRMPA
jgi:magnesium chelatase family protein